MSTADRPYPLRHAQVEPRASRCDRMRRFLAENAMCVLWASLCSAALAWLGLYGTAWSDYELEVQPAAEALAHLHIGEFLRLAPIYGGSLIERAPFAVLPGLWH